MAVTHNCPGIHNNSVSLSTESGSVESIIDDFNTTRLLSEVQ